MAVRVTAIHLVGGSQHEHIASLRWTQDGAGSGESTRAQLVTYIEDQSGSVYVSDGTTRVAVAVVTPASGPKYLRTHADGKWSDNLLALPRF